jgi:hypothetical protein
MGAKHIHYDVIVAWAAGEEIQVKANDEWLPVRANPTFYLHCEYRIKPKLVKKEGWVNVYRSRFTGWHYNLSDTKEQADEKAEEARVACIRIEWEGEE